MSKIDIEGTIFTALRVAPELFEQRALAEPLARNELTRSAAEAREALAQLDKEMLRVVEGSGAVTEPERRALLIAALREAHKIYMVHAKDESLTPRICQQFERQAADARVVTSRLEVGTLHVIQGLRVVRSSEE